MASNLFDKPVGVVGLGSSKNQASAKRVVLRPKVINFNILPAEYQPAHLNSSDLLLILVVVVGLALVALLNDSFVDLQTRVADGRVLLGQTSQRVEQIRRESQPQVAQLRGQTDEVQKQLQAQNADLNALKVRQFPWFAVLNKVFGALPPGVALDSVNQGGASLTVSGHGPDYAAPLVYAERLRDSGLFSSVSFQVIQEVSSGVPPAPPLSTQPVPGAVPPVGGALIPPGGAPVPGIAPTPGPRPDAGVVPVPPVSTVTSIPVPAPTPLPTPTPRPTSTVVPSPTPANTPTPTTSPTPRATPTPIFDYSVISQAFTDFPNERDQNDTVKGKVVDLSNALVPGLRFRISSCCPAWSTEYPREWEPPSDGTFEFALTTTGIFKLEVLSGRAQAATGLFTDGGFKGARVWEITFQKLTQGTLSTPTPTVVTTVTPTPTRSGTATPTPTVTGIVSNLWGEGGRPLAGAGEYVRLVSFIDKSVGKGGSVETGSLQNAAATVSFVINLEVKAKQ